MNTSELIKTITIEWYKKWIDLIFTYIKNTHDILPGTIENISKNINLLPEYIYDYPTFPWIWNYILRSPHITVEWVENAISSDKWPNEINKSMLSWNPFLTLPYIKSYPDIEWNINILSQSTFVTEEWVLTHLEYDLNWEHLVRTLSYHFLLQPTIIENIKHSKKWFYRILSANPTVTSDCLEQYFMEEWLWTDVLLFSCISADWVDIKNIDYFLELNDSSLKRTKWYYYSSNLNLTPQFVEQHIHYDWNWISLSKHPSMFDLVKKYKNHPLWKWDWHTVSIHPSIEKEYDFIIENINKDWHWGFIFEKTPLLLKKYIPLEILEIYNKYENILFIKSRLGYNPYLSLEDVYKLVKDRKINKEDETYFWLYFSKNQLNYARNEFIEQKMKEKILNYIRSIIHPELVEYIYHPLRVQRLLDNEHKYRWKL